MRIWLFVLVSQSIWAYCRAFLFPSKPLSRLSYRSASFELSVHKDDNLTATVRLNKVFKAKYSRREADKLIEQGRVTVNGKVSFGCLVIPHQDQVALDGRIVHGWESMNDVDERNVSNNDSLEYVKYWKPKGITCTTDRRVKGNIIDEITRQSGYRPKHRVYPIGRLDKDSTGLILLTSDGRLPNAVLRKESKKPKVYHVTVHRSLSETDLQKLREGIIITTVAQRDGQSKPLTAKTKPCIVERLSHSSCNITLEEGRNRQIRKMMEALGHEVLELHRTHFGEISIHSLRKEGEWERLSFDEMNWIHAVLQNEQG
jgi:23S rRNA pseudouridine2604 synthase